MPSPPSPPAIKTKTKKITFSIKRKALGKPSTPISRREWSEENISKSYKRLEGKGKVVPVDTMKAYVKLRYSDCAVNKCLHTVASSWTF